MMHDYSIAFRQAEPSEPFVTRQEQLALKPEKTRGRGRGRGRGTARGRGGAKDASKDDDKTGKCKKTKAANKVEAEDSCEAKWEEDWWGHNEEEAWGYDDWGTSGAHWDTYARYCGDEALYDIKGAEKKTPEDTANTEEPKKKKSRRDGKAPKTKENNRATLKEPSAASTSKQKRKKECSEVEKKESRTEKKPRNQGKRRMQEEDTETAAEVYEGDIPKIKKYIEAYKDSSLTEIGNEERNEMRARNKVSGLQECRLNVYWKTPAVGCTSKSLKKDIAYFNFKDEAVNYMSNIAAALKCGKLFVTWINARNTFKDATVIIVGVLNQNYSRKKTNDIGFSLRGIWRLRYTVYMRACMHGIFPRGAIHRIVPLALPFFNSFGS